MPTPCYAVKVRMNMGHLLLFLHGLGCTKESFDDVFKASSLKGYSLYSLDFPGFGDSSKPADFSYDMQDQAQIVLKVLDKLEYEKLTIVTHSMGGAVGVLVMELLNEPDVMLINVEGNLVAEDCGLVSRNVAKQTPEDFVAGGC